MTTLIALLCHISTAITIWGIVRFRLVKTLDAKHYIMGLIIVAMQILIVIQNIEVLLPISGMVIINAYIMIVYLIFFCISLAEE
jgi:hypothetical protein